MLRPVFFSSLSIKALDAEMKRILDNGYAINLGEYRADVGGLAAPIFDSEGKVVAALGISGPLSRLSSAKIKEFSALVSRSAKAVTAMIRQA